MTSNAARFRIRVPESEGHHYERWPEPHDSPVTFGRCDAATDLWITKSTSVSAVAGAFVWADGGWWLVNPYRDDDVARPRLRAAAADSPMSVELAAGGACRLWSPQGALRVLAPVRQDQGLPRLNWYGAPVAPWPEPVGTVLGAYRYPTGTLVDLRPVRPEIVDALAVLTWPTRHWSAHYFLTFRDAAWILGEEESTVRSWITRDYANQIAAKQHVHVPVGIEARQAICNLVVENRVITVDDDIRVSEKYGPPPQIGIVASDDWVPQWRAQRAKEDRLALATSESVPASGEDPADPELAG